MRYLLALTFACASAPHHPSAPGWTALSAMPIGHGEPAIAALNGKIYLSGGYDTSPSVMIYDIASDRWTIGPALPRGTDNAGSVAANGKVWVFGGEANNVVQVFDPAAGSWALPPPMPVAGFSSVVEEIDGKVHVVGGWFPQRGGTTTLQGHDVYDLATGTWSTAAQMTTPRNHAVWGSIGGKLYVVGGRAPGHEASDAQNVPTAEVYDPATDRWSAIAPMPTPRSGGAAAVLNGKLYVLGGGLPGQTVWKTVERYDPATDAWERLTDMPVEATGHRAVAVGNSIYVFGGFPVSGGQRQGFGGITDAWRYAP